VTEAEKRAQAWRDEPRRPRPASAPVAEIVSQWFFNGSRVPTTDKAVLLDAIMRR
jgi:hypothetical protein